MNKELKNLLVFGYGFASIFLFFAYRISHKHGMNAWVYLLMGLAVVLMVVSILRLPLLKKIYDAWMKITMPIGIVMTSLILIILFFGIFGVVGIILRLLRKDPLDRSINKGAKSYWIIREQLPFDKERYTKQF